VGEAMDESPFQDLIRRVRSGDEEAAQQLVKEYEPAIKRAARIRLADSRLRRIFDSSDISQSVFASFFVRAALGEYDLDRPAHLLALLVAMSQKKLTDHIRAEGALRRDYRRVRLLAADEPVVNSNPGGEVAAKELIADFRRRMSTEEREVADARAGGQSWQDIGAVRGESPDAVRVRFSRAVDRIAGEVGLDI
jgi:RNA polymerase sigma-70 factor (ECF subfamily)